MENECRTFLSVASETGSLARTGSPVLYVSRPEMHRSGIDLTRSRAPPINAARVSKSVFRKDRRSVAASRS